ncbi:von Willebrand factor C domain-containing protein 2-like [Lampetra planeri]
MAPARRLRALWWSLLALALRSVPAESHPAAASPPGADSTLSAPPDYVLEDYRGKGCLDETGYVYKLGEEFSPGHSSCPCRCTVDGPVCPKPECPRISASRCARVEHNGCCPECKEVRSECEYRGATYGLLQEFKPSPCERCRCEANGEVSCVVADCAVPECVNPVYEPEQCCPVCKHGANCYADTRVIPAGHEVRIDTCTVCSCPLPGNSGYADRQAVCIKQDCQGS